MNAAATSAPARPDLERLAAAGGNHPGAQHDAIEGVDRVGAGRNDDAWRAREGLAAERVAHHRAQRRIQARRDPRERLVARGDQRAAGCARRDDRARLVPCGCKAAGLSLEHHAGRACCRRRADLVQFGVPGGLGQLDVLVEHRAPGADEAQVVGAHRGEPLGRGPQVAPAPREAPSACTKAMSPR